MVRNENGLSRSKMAVLWSRALRWVSIATVALPARTFHNISCHEGTNEMLTSRFAELAEILARPVCFLSNGKEAGKPKG